MGTHTNVDDLRVPNHPIPTPKMSGSNNAGPAGQEKINTDIITLTRWLTEEQHKHKEATGDFQKKLDVIGNDIFVSAMKSSGRVRVLVSEEVEEAIIFDENPNSRYAVVCDPIDGSSNLDAGVSVGTIFGIFKLAEGAKGTKEDLLHPGTDLVAAGFTMYGASAQLVMTMKGGSVNGF